MATRPTPQQFVQRWQQGAAAAGQRYLDGVATSADWAANFVAAEQQMIAGIQAAIADGRITRHVQALGTAGWRQKTQAKGSQPWITGINNGVGAMTTGVGILYGYLDAAAAALGALPRGTFDQNVQRMVTQATTVHTQAVQRKATT